MTELQIASLLIVLAGLFGAVNALVFRLPSTIGILVVSLLASLAVMALGLALPGLGIVESVRGYVADIDFSQALLEGMLGLLLFAGALHVNLGALRSQAVVVALMATLGVCLSTALVGAFFWWWLALPPLVALVFGALISPTDPVAVLGVLREARLPKSLETKIAGESLFNDGVAYVLFLVLVALAFPRDAAHPLSAADAALLFLKEAGGGALLGGVLGWLTFALMKRIDDYALEVLLSLGLAFGGYQLAVALHVSGPIMAVVAGLLIGDVGMRYGMSELTREYLDAFWKMIDEILNAILFLLIGVEVFVVAFSLDHLVAGAAAIAVALVARLVAVAVPVALLSPFRSFAPGVIPIMTWGGLKGGISVALVLSLPPGEYKPLLVAMTYVVVIFSIVIQGLTVGPLARRLGREPDLL